MNWKQPKNNTQSNSNPNIKTTSMEKGDVPCRIKPLVQDIKTTANYLNFISCKHIYREANIVAADKLAHLGLTLLFGLIVYPCLYLQCSICISSEGVLVVFLCKFFLLPIKHIRDLLARNEWYTPFQHYSSAWVNFITQQLHHDRTIEGKNTTDQSLLKIFNN